jgi:general stress protein 26
MNKKQSEAINDESIIGFIKTHSVAAIATIKSDGTPKVDTIYYTTDESPEPEILFITKTDTGIYIDIRNNPAVALVITDEAKLTTLQLEGNAIELTDDAHIDRTIKKMNDKSAHPSYWPPPIVKMKRGDFVVLKISPKDVRLNDYRESK